MRYRWELSHRHGVPLPRFAPDTVGWTAWRPAESRELRKDPFAFEERLTLPIALTENCELLARSAEDGDEAAARLLRETLPTARRDFATFVQALDPWRDTFALWCLTRRERCLADLHPLAIAIATGYAATCEGGPVRGLRFPFHEEPLASASAHLASALLTLGLELELGAELISFVARSRRDDGGWGDGTGPSDVLTTLVCADLCAAIDPGFDLSPTQKCIASFRGSDGLWRAIGPDAPWLSAEVVELEARARAPFARRFRWPYLPSANRDHKTGLPFFAYFADLARLFGALEGIASAEVEIGFIDLVGFRVFNNAFGQDRGDDVLRVFARELESLEECRAVRDGGDEFLLVGSPTGGGLRAELDRFRRAWPSRFRAHFGADVPPVVPRIVVGASRGRSLVRARESLGRQIGTLKGVPIGDDGLLVEAEPID